MFLHVLKTCRLLDLSFQVFFCVSVSRLGFWVCLPVHASCMRTHTTGLHMQAYICAHILVSRNPNFEFSISILSFILHHMSLLSLSCILLHFLFLCSHVYLSLYARLWFSS